MPGFTYHLACRACGIESESYPLLPFHQITCGDLRFAVVDLDLRAFGSLDLYLSLDPSCGPCSGICRHCPDPRDRRCLPFHCRDRCQRQPGTARQIAARWSGPGRIVVVPEGLHGRLWPDPVPCPSCGGALTGRSAVA